MKEPCFNELSLLPLCETDECVDVRINEFVNILKICGFLGFRKIRFDKSAKELELKKDYYLKDYLANKAKGNSNRACLILNMFMTPFVDDDTKEEEDYINHSIRIIRGKELIDAEGLKCSYISRGFSVGFASDPFWSDNISFKLSIIDDKTGAIWKCEAVLFIDGDARRFATI